MKFNLVSILDMCFVPQMCGVDGVTFPSICHASLHNSHVDYPGRCDEVDPKNNGILKNSVIVGHFNPRCKTVKELARCPGVNCENRVIPEGSCCLICGKRFITNQISC